MSYSRRQLYAMGEPLGDSATYRKADGGLVLGGGGGGGGSAPSSTTNTQELPEWARGYAKDVLAKGAAVTDINQNPYTAYQGNRVAGLSEMQKSAINQTGPQGFQNTVGQYMNPYLQHSLAPQIAEANRSYDISAANESAKATQQGAFGGGRSALMQAENERNRNMNLANIVGQGYNNAYGAATQQYNTGLGQQLQMGNMQQAQEQRGLDTAYQDFLGQKNYPYQQLSYMANLVRGTPMGMNSASQVYQGPGNIAGQIAGLGIGAAGISKLMAEGGLAYDNGGRVEDPRNIEAIVSKLSDAQLDQALKAAASRGDAAQIEAIQQELAMRASERNGIASAVTPDMADEMMPSAANGGIVAFADEGLVKKSPEKATSSFGEFIEKYNPFSSDEKDKEYIVKDRQAAMTRSYDVSPFEKLTPEQRAQAAANKKIAEKHLSSATTPSTYTEPKTAAEKAALEEKIRATMGNKVLPPVVTARGREDFDAFSSPLPRDLTSNAPKKGLGAALAQANPNTAQNAVVPEQSLEDRAMGIYRKFNAMSKDDLKSLNDAIESRKGDADKIKEKGLSEALMQFGFNMAAQASKPGSRQGLAGVLSSAASASPILGQVAAENEKLQRAASDNYMKLKMDQTRYQVALNKGDMTAATSLAAQIRQGDMQQKQLDALVDYHNKQLSLEAKKIGLMGENYNKGTSLQQVARELAAQPENRGKTMTELMTQASTLIGGAGLRSETTLAGALVKSVQDALKEDMGYKGLQAQLMAETNPAKRAKIEQAMDDYAGRIEQRQRKILGMAGGPASTGGGGTLNPDLFQVKPVK